MEVSQFNVAVETGTYCKNNVQISHPPKLVQLRNELLDAALSNEVAFDPKVTGDQTLSLEFMEGT